MSHAGWGALWNQALTLFGAESIQIRILVGLGVAFIVLMIVEGLRASFLPATRGRQHVGKPADAALPEMKPVRKADGAGLHTVGMSSVFRPRGKARVSSPKRLKGQINRHRVERPKIRRIPGNSVEATLAPAPTFTEEAAPYSPLPPNPE